MKRMIIGLSVLLTTLNAFAFTPEIKTIPLNDGEVIEARLCLPESEVKTVTQYKTYLFNDAPFDSLDVVKDELIDIKDIFQYHSSMVQSSFCPRTQ